MQFMLSLLLMSGLLSFFSTEPQMLIQPEKVRQWYQPQTPTPQLDMEVEFWREKLAASPNQLTYHLQLAAAYEQRFATTGNIADLKAAELLLASGLEQASVQEVQFMRTLARNYISQHRFSEALVLAEAALAHSDSRLASTYLVYDTYMEVGRYNEAEQLLSKMAAQPNFQYLIRKAKWEDHQGNLTFAIHLLEEAKAAVNPEQQRTQAIWLYANLADFYGHAGRVEEAYEHYHMTLMLDPAHWYAYKGLAWIAYAHDRNVAAAQEMVFELMRYNDRPELHLFLAELYAYANNRDCAQAEEEAFQAVSAAPAFGHMYRIPRLEIYLEQGQAAAAFSLAGAEVEERPTPETYGYLAWVLYQQGMKDTAQDLARREVWQQTVEPVALRQLSTIFPDNREIQRFVDAELEGAAFELGPLVYEAL